MSRLINTLARRPWLCATLLALTGLVLSASSTWFHGIPLPRSHDEQSYLLAARTFAEGRLTNPTHPHWQHFETFHTIHVPSYMSKYPAAQSLFMAFGMRLTGEPITGIWLSGALLYAAVLWMLRAWMPARWALLGALLFVLTHGGWDRWMISYWGGNVAALGGVLLYGGYRRVTRGGSPRDAVLTAVGIGLLANSRPFEGLIACLPVGIGLVIWWFKAPRSEWPGRLRCVVLPMVAGLAVIAGLMAFYNYRVTGNPATLPYVAWSGQYEETGRFLWEPLIEKEIRHNVIKQFHRELLTREVEFSYSWDAWREGRGTIGPVIGDILLFWNRIATRFLMPFAGVFLLLIIPAARHRRTRLALTAFALGLCGVMLANWYWDHYFAPFAAAAILLVMAGTRILAAAVRRVPCGRIIVVAGILLITAAHTLGEMRRYRWREIARVQADDWNIQRAQLTARLKAQPRAQLVFVRYGSGHRVDHDWVFNEPDIDAAPIAWARDLGTEANAPLLEYFESREAWLLIVDPPGAAGTYRLTPYAPQGLSHSSR